MAIHAIPTKNALQSTLSSTLSLAETTSFAITDDWSSYLSDVSATRLIILCIDRVDANGTRTPTQREYISATTVTGGSGTTFTTLVRGLGGSTQQAHTAGAVVEIVVDINTIKSITDGFLVEHNSDGTHNLSGVVTIDGTSSTSAGVRLAEDTDNGTNYIGLKSPSAVTTSVDLVLPDGAGSANQVLTTDGSGTLSWSSASGGTAYWTAVAGTPTRASDTQFTITDTSNANSYDLLFKKGVILKWLESTTVNVGMVISSSYGANTVTVNIVGDSLTAGFTDMKYCMQMAQTLDFIVAGTLAAGTDLARSHYATTALIKLSVDAYVKTAGTTNATVFDINDDGTTIITTKPSIASTATSDIDNVCDAPTTVIAQDSVITADVDSVSTTAPVEAYLKLFVFPSSWLYRS